MFTLSEAAAAQIKNSAKQSQSEGLPLRIAAKKNVDGSFHYGVGFEDKTKEEDLAFKSHDITILIAPQSIELLNGTEMDFVKMDDGEERFIFKNPNDPSYTAEDNKSEHNL
ncbi:hypothetical protein MNBD_GAMMA23-167 [hydrothermal vent metagenome]|uniref:Core domain-containing protein n=1 Tax=hydrothermal vent metagenome TaxID=652676 RepID=A0A3B0ZUX1_9ZZZZ